MSDTGDDETSDDGKSHKNKRKQFTRLHSKTDNEVRIDRRTLQKERVKDERRISNMKEAEAKDSGLLPTGRVSSQISRPPIRLGPLPINRPLIGRPKLGHTPAPALDVELKNVLLNDSMASTVAESQQGTKRRPRKLDLLELARSEAEVIEIMRKLSSEKSDPEDEPTCCMSRKGKEKKELENLGESSEDEGFRVSKDEVLMSRTQRASKLLVGVVAAIDFVLAAQDTLNILIRKMQIEYLFMVQIYNCGDLIGSGDNWLIWANCVHALLSVGLLYMEDRNTSSFGIYWLISQSARTVLMVFEAFFRSRFKPRLIFVFLSFLWWRLPLDLIQMGIVLFRYYKLNNPFPGRLKALATEIHLDRPLNNELRLRDSTFLQSKFRLREAAAFQTLEIIRKVKKAGKESRMRTRLDIIRTELAKAFNVLKNPKRYPTKQTRTEAQKKEERVDDDDKKTILPEVLSQVSVANLFQRRSADHSTKNKKAQQP